MKNSFNVQVSKDHYNSTYDTLPRFVSYFYQIDIVRSLNPKNVLEIGIGNKTVSNYLKQNGIETTTCDFAEDLNPDTIADIRKLPFEDENFEVVMACEVIEHIPWQDVQGALSELQRVTSKYVVISVPYSSIAMEMLFKIPILDKVLKYSVLSLFFRIPAFFLGIKFNGEHYWEMGRKGYSKRTVKKEFSKFFKISKEIRPILNEYHYFFILEKK